jgi:hypothetical protein
MTDQNILTETEDAPRVKTYAEVQDELIEDLAYLVPYWLQTKLERHRDNLTYRLAGMIHSLHATFSGCSGGFGPSIDMYPFSTEEEAQRLEAGGKNFFAVGAENSSDINDGGLKYHRGEEYAPVPEDSVPPREWTPEEGRALFLNKVADFLHEAVAKEELSDLEKGGYMLRAILDLFENGTEDFPKVMLLAVTQAEDTEYYIENEENYYEEDGTQLTGQERLLLEVWDFYWARIVRRHAGLYVKPLYQG